MTPIMFRRLVLDTGDRSVRRFFPEPEVDGFLASLCARRGYVSLPSPMNGYGVDLTEARDGMEGVFHVWLERNGGRVRYSTCFYCATPAKGGGRFAAAVEAYRLAAAAGRVRPGMTGMTELRQPQGLPWVAALRWKVPHAPPEAPLLEDAVFTALVAGPQPAVCSSRGLPGSP